MVERPVKDGRFTDDEFGPAWHDWPTCRLCRQLVGFRCLQIAEYRRRTAAWCAECGFATGHAPDCEEGRWLRLRRGRRRGSDA